MKSFTYFSGVCLLICIVYSHANKTDIVSSLRWPERVMQKIQGNRLYASLLLGKSIEADQNICVLCDVLIGLLLEEKSLGMTNVQLSSEGEYFCEVLNFEDAKVCEGVIGPHVDVLSYIVEEATINNLNICAMLLDCEQGQDYFDWDLDIPEGETVEKVESTGAKTFRIGHITDIHYDPNYTEGKAVDCGEPLCCQSDQNDAKSGEEACGYWGASSNSDAPLQLVEEVFKEMVKKDLDYVYFTGDLVSHRVWETSRESNTATIKKIVQLFKSTFNDIPVYPVLGNHEAHPVNVFAPLSIGDDLNTQWLYDLILDEWSAWLNTDSIKETIRRGGFYTVLVREGFRVVVLNNNVCSIENWWNLYDNNDPYGQLKWLVEVLEQAEKDKEIVHILYHIQTSSCLGSWGKAFRKILNRFSNTVAAQFNGHTHRDQFFVHYNSDNKPIGVSFNGGSLIADSGAPNYKVHLVDSTGFDVWDTETYTFDLKTANEKKSIDWKKLYSFREAFGTQNALTPTELDALVFNSLNKNSTLASLYHRYYYKDGPGEAQKECDKECQKNLLCEIVTTVHNDTNICKKL
ncbi:sphingomyelin phosphodiesterase-like [Diorhabda sublineata]|uniref:sphingomyelin phosphodiesterase-like n=1 Tax=Diorhabda sublineata TaxID=1163346 RepID=UPI0024E0A5BB|nr:sphingomyelin phosphodiesterase-like [Diorhabda sublineata]